MKLIGWDVGIKNLSYCVIDYNENDYKIFDWGIIDLRYENEEQEDKLIDNSKAKAKPKKCLKISLKDLSRNLYKKLEQNNNFSNFDYVIIENQPVLKNPTMKSILANNDKDK